MTDTNTTALSVQIEASFRAFVKTADERRRKMLLDQYPSLDHGFLSVDDGRRYWRVVTNDGSRSVYCFVDKTNGDVLKAASWKAPAKHARGNVLNADNGMGAVTPWGAAYLR